MSDLSFSGEDWSGSPHPSRAEINTYDTLDEVPWNSVSAVTSPSGNTVGINAAGFAEYLTGPRSGQRIPLDAHGPWRDA